ncbi:hypothetical protein [Maribacter arcticus]|uniref:hypothetical protein n=1 Tax=Maribacter arcticus TaxID=561365 RepID=UPI001F182768|nr:hypothetical protein [Maribacter arcticus]
MGLIPHILKGSILAIKEIIDTGKNRTTPIFIGIGECASLWEMLQVQMSYSAFTGK